MLSRGIVMRIVMCYKIYLSPEIYFKVEIKSPTIEDRSYPVLVGKKVVNTIRILTTFVMCGKFYSLTGEATLL